MNLLIKQAILVPLYFFVPVLIAGALTVDYSAISQHASEITLTDNSTAITILNSGAILSGLSCILLSVGLLILKKRKHLFSACLLYTAPYLAKWVLILLMMIGRLEIFTVLIIFSPGFWKQ